MCEDCIVPNKLDVLFYFILFILFLFLKEESSTTTKEYTRCLYSQCSVKKKEREEKRNQVYFCFNHINNYKYTV